MTNYSFSTDLKPPFTPPKITEGEIFLSEYFKEENIKYESQVKISKLKGDNKAFRVADFYLEEYKVYVEFNGQFFHGEEHRERYWQKKDIYNSNKVPCVFIYPDNLGIIEHIFHKR